MIKLRRFRKKPVVVVAVRLTETNMERVLNTINGVESDCGRYAMTDGDHCVALVIQTLEGEMLARVGDWIIRGVEGEFYPCKNSVFVKTYDEVGE